MEVNIDSATIQPETMYDYMNGLFLNPSSYIIIALVIVAYIVVFLSLGKNTDTSVTPSTNIYSESSGDAGSNIGYKILIGIVVVMFIVLLISNGLQYFFGVNVMASVKDIFTGQPHIDIVIDNPLPGPSLMSSPVPEIKYEKQVFNIPGNYYGYEDAKTLCSAYGSRLATYGEIEDSYDKGGEWCNYGWSDGQMALFPTQKETYDGLQKIKGHEHDCGRPGINGGYMANPHLKYGVNCYGYKPKITGEEEEIMQMTSPYPKTEKDVLMEKRVDYWKTKIGDILISPFNYKNWSKI